MVEAGRYPFTGRLGVLGAQDHEAVRAALEATGVAGLADRDFAHVSDGQRQRVLLARALCQEPRVLVLDEPTSYLDVRSQLDMLQLLRREARERGIAVVASLHEIDLAQKAADHVVCIRDGCVVFQGTPEEIFTAERMARLYGLSPESYDPAFGSVELARPEGAPEVFVLAGAARERRASGPSHGRVCPLPPVFCTSTTPTACSRGVSPRTSSSSETSSP